MPNLIKVGGQEYFGLSWLISRFCLCLSEETLKAVGPFYLVSMPGEIKLPGVYARGSKRSHTGGKCVTCCGLSGGLYL